MISVSEFSARLELLDGLRLPSSRFRPSPKPIATEGTPIARMREHTTAARPEKRKDFMTTVTPRAQPSCALERFRPPVVFRVTPRERPALLAYRSPGCCTGLTD